MSFTYLPGCSVLGRCRGIEGRLAAQSTVAQCTVLAADMCLLCKSASYYWRHVFQGSAEYKFISATFLYISHLDPCILCKEQKLRAIILLNWLQRFEIDSQIL